VKSCQNYSVDDFEWSFRVAYCICCLLHGYVIPYFILKCVVTGDHQLAQPAQVSVEDLFLS
jgi:hypothetical protein